MNPVVLWGALGAFSMGVVVAFIMADRTALPLPADYRSRLLLGAWVAALWTGTLADAMALVGLVALPWLAAGIAVGALTHLVIFRAW
jgi:hypothetical protein